MRSSPGSVRREGAPKDYVTMMRSPSSSQLEATAAAAASSSSTAASRSPARPWNRKKRRFLDDIESPERRRRSSCDSTAGTSRRTAAGSDAPLLVSDEAAEAGVPFVEIDGTPYYSDRFYLNTSLLESHRKRGSEGADKGSAAATGKGDEGDRVAGSRSTSSCCRCGRGSSSNRDLRQQPVATPPPLFDRSKLVESLHLKAAILGTYCFEVATLQSEFPSLFGSSNGDDNIPTLVLHGHRGRTVSHFQKKGSSNSKRTDDHHGESQDSGSACYRGESGSLHETASNARLCTQEGGVKNWQRRSQRQHPQKKDLPTSAFVSPFAAVGVNIAAAEHDYDSHGDDDDDDDQSHCPVDVREDEYELSDTTHFTEICSTWTPPADVPTRSNLLRDNGCLSEYAIKARRHRKGVHHPKFMILFETSGSVVITVSTGNLTQPFTNDATWLQRFHPIDDEKNKNSHGEAVDGGLDDFGDVMADFLFQQTLSSRPEQLTPLGFVQRYLGYRSFADFQSNFDFSTAQVHLIATVPGDHEGRLRHHHPEKSKRRPRFYGRQRVADVLSRVTFPPNLDVESSSDFRHGIAARRPRLPWLSRKTILSDEDRLIFQPTSFGSDWRKYSLAEVVRSFWGHDDRTGETTQELQQAMTDDELLQRLDIIWPTDNFMRSARDSLLRFFPRGRDTNSNGSMVVRFGIDDEAVDGKEGKHSQQQVEEERENEGYLFLSSETFNKIDLECLSRMAFFEESFPKQRNTTLIPHFKSAARVYEGERFRESVSNGVAFSWFLMTSACLSRGAQGDIVPECDCLVGSDAVSYRNFEMGVLFCSRVQGKRRTDRVYSFNPNKSGCSCAEAPLEKTNLARGANGRRTPHPRLIHLPVPFDLHPGRYRAEPCYGFDDEEDCDDSDGVEFCETPYFHEVPCGTGSTGNMRITPYGAALATRYDKEL